MSITVPGRPEKLSPDLVRAMTTHPLGHRPAVFIETGTFLGRTAAQMAAHMPTVVTIELSPQLAARARARFRTTPGVTVRQGDSAVELPRVLAAHAEPCTIYLDAHWVGHHDCAQSPLPLAAELAACAAHGQADIVVVDDVKSMGVFPGWEWVSVAEVVHRLPRVLGTTQLEDHLVVWLGAP